MSRNWLVFGTGVGIEIGASDLRVVVVRVRPSGAEVAGAHTIERYPERPAAEWGAEAADFTGRHGAGHLAATVVLPRREVIVRTVQLPGVEPKDMEAALALQIDSLHPYAEGEAAWTWARLGKSKSVMVGIARRAYVDRQLELLAEAGIKVASFTFSAAAIHGAIRLFGAPPADGVLGLMETAGGVEVYGESPARAAYSATFSESWERAALVAAGELRAPVTPVELSALTPKPRGELPAAFQIAYLGALAAACPRYSLGANLLPEALRRQSSKLIYAPTLALGVLLVAGMAALGFYQRYEDRNYLNKLNEEVKFLEPRARQLQHIERRIAETRRRMQMLDQFQLRTKADLDAVKEVTRLVPPPAWLNMMELSRTTLTIGGEADQATGLLKSLDSSAQFRDSEFVIPLSRVGNVEAFRIRAGREGVQP